MNMQTPTLKQTLVFDCPTHMHHNWRTDFSLRVRQPGPQVSEHTTAKAVLFFLHSKSYKLFSGHLCCSDDDGKEHDGCLTFVKELNAAAGKETINVTHYSWTLTNA